MRQETFTILFLMRKERLMGVRITQRTADKYERGCCATSNSISPNAAKPRIFPLNG